MELDQVTTENLRLLAIKPKDKVRVTAERFEMDSMFHLQVTVNNEVNDLNLFYKEKSDFQEELPAIQDFLQKEGAYVN